MGDDADRGGCGHGECAEPFMSDWNDQEEDSPLKFSALAGGFPPPVRVGDFSVSMPNENPMAGGFPNSSAVVQSPINPPSNSLQRWQRGTAAQQPIRDVTPAQRFFAYTGRIDGTAPEAQTHEGLNYSDRGAHGFTPDNEWAGMFQTPMQSTPQAIRPMSGYSWETNYPKTAVQGSGGVVTGQTGLEDPNVRGYSEPSGNN